MVTEIGAAEEQRQIMQNNQAQQMLSSNQNLYIYLNLSLICYADNWHMLARVITTEVNLVNVLGRRSRTSA